MKKSRKQSSVNESAYGEESYYGEEDYYGEEGISESVSKSRTRSKIMKGEEEVSDNGEDFDQIALA